MQAGHCLTAGIRAANAYVGLMAVVGTLRADKRAGWDLVPVGLAVAAAACSQVRGPAGPLCAVRALGLASLSRPWRVQACCSSPLLRAHDGVLPSLPLGDTRLELLTRGAAEGVGWLVRTCRGH